MQYTIYMYWIQQRHTHYMKERRRKKNKKKEEKKVKIQECFNWSTCTSSCCTFSDGKPNNPKHKKKKENTHQAAAAVQFVETGSSCEGVTYWATSIVGVKDRSITQPRVILIAPSPPLNGGVFGASGSYTSVRWPVRFVWLPREPGRQRCVF